MFFNDWMNVLPKSQKIIYRNLYLHAITKTKLDSLFRKKKTTNYCCLWSSNHKIHVCVVYWCVLNVYVDGRLLSLLTSHDNTLSVAYIFFQFWPVLTAIPAKSRQRPRVFVKLQCASFMKWKGHMATGDCINLLSIYIGKCLLYINITTNLIITVACAQAHVSIYIKMYKKSPVSMSI